MKSKIIKYVLLAVFIVLLVIGVVCLLRGVEAFGKFCLFIIFATLLGSTI